MTQASPYPKGSEWRKWDLHVHSPFSILNNNYPRCDDGEPDWDQFIEKLESLDVSVIGITDYFSIEGYKKILEYKNNGRLQNIDTILPNIEFRLSSVLSSRRDGEKPRRLNFHVIFSNEVSCQNIEEHFLHDIHFFYEGNPQDRDECRKLKISNLRDFGADLIDQHREFRGNDPLKIGAKCAVVNHEEITDLLCNDSRFKGKYLIVFPEELYNLIDWDGQDHHVRKGILQKSDMVFSSSPNTINWCMGESPYEEGVKSFIREFKTLKPCIHGSDAHELNEVAAPCIKRGVREHICQSPYSECEMRYCWIKADPTFEGLKQILYEPRDRVAIQSDDPTPSRSNLTINKIIIPKTNINNELSIAETDIEINHGLVAITGSKGAGKTAFVDLIANCFQDRANTNDQNSFVKRIADQNTSLEIKLAFKGNSSFSKTILEDKYYEGSSLSYIAQGELEKYVGSESDLDKYLASLIFNSPNIINSVEKYEYLNTKTYFKELLEKIEKKSSLIASIEKELSSNEIKDIEKNQKKYNLELEDITQRIDDFEKKQEEKQILIAKTKQDQISKLKTKIENFLTLKTQIKLAIGFINEDLPRFNQLVTSINELIKVFSSSDHYSSIVYPDAKKLENLQIKTEEEIQLILKKIKDIETEIQKLEYRIQHHASMLAKKKNIELKLEKLHQKIKEAKQKEKDFEVEVKERTALFKEQINTILSLKKKYNKVISLFSSKKAKVLSDMDFIADVNINLKKLLKDAEDVIDNRKIIVQPEGDKWEFKVLVDLYEKIIQGDTKSIGSLVEEVELLNNKLKTKLKPSSFVDSIDFYRFLYGNYLYVIPLVKYKSIPVNKLSLGQKATVLLKIYLAEGDNPIIVDSHDDYLDNAFIMQELIFSIREAKKFRQVILVSNNGNVVINSDAEQVIIANISKSGLISYNSGSIENPKIRDAAIKVLEGGQDAFMKRQQKYRI